MGYIALTPQQIQALEQGGNLMDGGWNNFLVSESFTPEEIRNCRFSGSIRMGKVSAYNARLHNVEVADGAVLENVHDCISDYLIESGAHICNVGRIVMDGESTFGNGVSVAVLSEAGGCEVKMHEGLSSHEAYLSALNRNFASHLDALVDDFSNSRSSSRGTIGKGSVIRNLSTAINVNFGAGCAVDSASLLENGTIAGGHNPAYAGHNVICRNFIISEGSRVDEGATLERCFVGQSCTIGHQFSATDCLFFSNCQAENGEACSVFAGPFTVTHHKCTLLIAAMFSFMNAGSGSNQSNHMYKLGPVHCGILARGCKTASGSHVMWPAKAGAFTLVMGHHHVHFNTEDFPFSYITEKEGRTCLYPGVNLRTVGTARDAAKWPERDARAAEGRTDHINFALFTPYTAGAVLRGINALEALVASDPNAEAFDVSGAHLKMSSMRKGLRLYKLAIDKYLFGAVVDKIMTGGNVSLSALKADFNADACMDQWMDVSGMIVLKSKVDALLQDMKEGRISQLKDLDKSFAAMSSAYAADEWKWICAALAQYAGINFADMDASCLAAMVDKWCEAAQTIDAELLEDARKEIDMMGIEEFDAHPFVKEVKDRMARTELTCTNARNTLNQLN